MRKPFYFTLIICFGLSTQILFGQTQKNIPHTLPANNKINGDGYFNGCGTDQIHKDKMKSDPEYAKRREELNKFIRNNYLQILDNQKHGNDNARGSGTVYTIPVVVHVMHLPGTPVGTDENISDATVQQGILDLNEGFRNVGFYDPSNGVDVEIEFCLALRDTNGQPSIGITRTATTLSNLNKDTADQALKDLDQWNTLKYMNIWLVNEICDGGGCGVAGYAYFAGAHGLKIDGIVNEARWFGSTKDNSKIHIHEAGHYFDLFHPWENGCLNNDCTADGDKVCDTPPDNSTNWIPCGNTENSCTTDEDDTTVNNPFRPVGMGGLGGQNDMIENYMDYGFQICQNTFTQGQKDRMQIALTGIRTSLLSSDGCNPAATPVSIFSSSPRITCTGSSVQFNDGSLNGPTAWTWSFEYGTPSSSNTKNPSITYNTPGIFDVSLVASNTLGNGSTETKPDYILVYQNIIAPACTVSTLDVFPSYDLSIINVTLQNINNTTGGATSDLRYQDFSCNRIDTLTAGTTYPISITLGNAVGQDLRVYLDYNNDGSFNNTNELVFSLDSVKNTNTGSIIISNTSVKNTIIRMRVITDSYIETISNACNSVQNGQAEDYGIVIQCYDDSGVPPISDITSDKTFGCAGSTINFMDNSLKCPTSWNWIINGGNPSSSSLPNPSSAFNTAGSFQIEMTASNSYGTGTTSFKPSYIKIYDAPDSTCTPFTANLTNNYGIGIVNVSFQNINNTTGTTVTDSGYLDFSCSILDTLRSGNTYLVTITTGSGNSLNLEDVKIYIDWNADGTLNPTDELVFNSQDIFTTHSGNIIVPSSAVKEKLLRMRVISDYYTFNINSSCYNPVFGQSEDYGIIVTCLATMQATTLITMASCSTCPDGNVIVSASGGTAPYSYIWDDPLQQTTNEANTLTPGFYAVTITDSNSCELVIDSILVSFPTGSCQANSKNFNFLLFPNPAKSIIKIIVSENKLSKKISIALIDIVGKKIKSADFISTDKRMDSFTIDISSIPEGLYIYSISIDNDFSAKGKIAISR